MFTTGRFCGAEGEGSFAAPRTAHDEVRPATATKGDGAMSRIMPAPTSLELPHHGEAGRRPSLNAIFSLCNGEPSGEYTPEKRSFRIHRHSTTLSLERAFWSVLELIAETEATTVAGLITRIHDHCQFVNDRNLASCLRVVCLKYVSLSA
jgi:predicted DNA-binding ribbon-helix-helix protein